MAFRLATYRSEDGSARAGIVVGESIVDAAAATGLPQYSTVLGILENWERAEVTIQEASRNPDQPILLSATSLLAPILYPGQIYAAGANYQDHIDEMVRQGAAPAGPNAKQAGGRPWHFIKASRSCVTGPGSDRAAPAHSKKVDWEIELAVVIGKAATNVAEATAMSHVAGYTIANDLSARDLIGRKETPIGSPFHYDFISAKNFDGACPMGPWIVPASDIPDPMNLSMKLWVDDKIMQDSSTRHMIFNIAEQIAELSSRLTLNPGDVILTGTPDGVGMGRNVFLQPGQRVRLWIEGIGEMEHRFTR